MYKTHEAVYKMQGTLYKTDETLYKMRGTQYKTHQTVYKMHETVYKTLGHRSKMEKSPSQMRYIRQSKQDMKDAMPNDLSTKGRSLDVKHRRAYHFFS